MVRIFIIIFFNFFIASCATLGNDVIIYKSAINNVKLDRLDFAFLDLRELVLNYPNSKYIKVATLSLAEYYFDTNNYYDAIDILLKYIKYFPQDKNIIFAKAFLYKIITSTYKDGNEEYQQLHDKLKEQFFSESLFLLFSSSKTEVYASILNNRYTIKEYIDRIEIFKNNELFLQILP